MTLPSAGKVHIADAVRRLVESRVAEVHVALPGRVVAYDYAQQRATVKPDMHRQYRDGRVDPYPTIVGVPMIWPRTSGGSASLTMPVLPGDPVLLLFSERSLERWLSTGGADRPGDPRKHDLTDAIAIPGLMPFSDTSAAENNEDVLLTFGAAKVRIKPSGRIEIETPNEVHIDGAAGVTVTSAATVTVNGAASVAITSAVQIEATAPLIVIDTDELRMGSAGGAGLQKLVDERMIPLYNTHTHGDSDPPNQQAAVGDHSTSKSRAT